MIAVASPAGSFLDTWKKAVRPSFGIHLLVLLALALASGALFSQVIDTGFWSNEDLFQLAGVADAYAKGQLPLAFHPVLAGGYPANPVFLFEFHAFGMTSWPYYVVNILVHVLNSWLAYVLVNTLLHDRRSAFMAAFLFALGVGSYGKNLMFVTGISSLVYATAVLLGTLLYVLNEKRNAGRPFGVYAGGFFAIFAATLFMRGGTFSLLASFAFYNLFFLRERQRRVLHTNLLVCVAVALVALTLRALSRPEAVTHGVDPGAFLRNLPGYLVLMVFPLHQSALLSTAPGFVRDVYAMAPVIRILVGWAIVSYSIFGFIFGNRTVRFYIAWMYVMVLPFAVFRYPADWLNLRFLYLVSVGFCVLLTTGTLYAFKLLSKHRYRRLVPFLIPAAYIALSAALVSQLDHKNHLLASDPVTEQRRAEIAARLER
jgi:hypothetical protein